MTSQPPTMRPFGAAFTLLEVVIALAVATTLVLFAVPSYRSHVSRAYRIDAASALYRAAQAIESVGVSATPALPPGMDRAPSSGVAAYTLSLLPADASNGGYALEAYPAAAGPMHDDACGIFVLDATGTRSNRSADDAPTPDPQTCWNAR